MSLHYPGGPNLVINRKVRAREGEVMAEAEVRDSRKKPQAEACRGPLEARKGRAQSTGKSTIEAQLPEPLEGMQSY